MRGVRVQMAVFTVVAALHGCQSGAGGVPGGGSGPDTTGGPRAGGTTSDFGGDCACDDLTMRELALAEPDPVLGFSAEEVLSTIEGEYTLTMQWADPCAGENAPEHGCTTEAPGFIGTTTEVQIAIERAATVARVNECNAGLQAHPCHITNLYVQVTGTLTTSDGLLDEPFALDIGSAAPDAISVGELLSAEDVSGALDAQVAEFAGIEWRFGVDAANAWFEVFVLAGDDRGHSRAVSQAPEGGRSPWNHSWGVEEDLAEARR